MSDVAASGTTVAATVGSNQAVAPTRVGASQIFREFLLIGATSFGGGVVAYLRSGLVSRRQKSGLAGAGQCRRWRPLVCSEVIR